ncbi:HWE histidine kinase domain-containing protein [Phenylobacterium sp. J367]|uniref:HWE histidine kinase domain-containing protein n=1 Tax=Phenylobacterium sp. J367 TaxID=2898435 RepID=UPI0021510761|nr:HWE histidine kinase domain-containing protein [Phenylobacterium sp. J367]MCR5879779.1 PAS domain-containing protein [Phenylobacterium sp. J367]
MTDPPPAAEAAPVSLSRLYLAVHELTAATRTSEVLEVLRHAVRTLTLARGVAVVARAEGLCHYLADDAGSALWPERRFPMEECVSGWAMLNGAPAVISDIYLDNRIPHEIYRSTFVRSLIMTPIGEGRAYAAFGAYWDHTRQHSPADVELLGALGSCAASALERIWLAEQLDDQRRASRDPPPATDEEGPDLLESLLRREGELADAHRRLNAILDNATVAVFLMDERQRCAYMNAAAETLTGYTFAETAGRTLHEMVHHTRPDGSPYPLEECPIDRAFPDRARMQGEEMFVRRDGSFYPIAFTASPILDEESRAVGTILEVQDLSERKAADAARELLMREVDHRSRNVLAVVQSVLRLSKGSDPTQLKAAVGDRIDVLARAQSSLARTNWQGARLRDLIQAEVEAVTSLDRVGLSGDDLMLEVEQVQPMCMILHELAANASKHGALSEPAGRLEISWSQAGGRLMSLTWRETGGPPVTPPADGGLGSRLIHQVARQLGASVNLAWPETGLVVTLRADPAP